MAAATPAELSLHNNFLHSLRIAKRGLVRASFYLAELVDRRIHRALGYTSGVNYAVQVGGLNENQARDLLRMGRKLRELPELAEAVERGSLSWGKARLLAPHASPQTVAGLVNRARESTVRELKADLRRRTGPRDSDGGSERKTNVPTPPSSVPRRSPTPQLEPRSSAPPATREESEPAAKTRRRHVVSLSFDDVGYAEWEAAVAALRSGARREELGVLHILALHALIGDRAPSIDTRASGPGTLLVLLHCPRCDAAAWCTSRGELTVERALLEAAHCDAVVEADSPAGPTRRSVIPPRLRRTVLRRDRYRCNADGCSHTRNLQVHHRVPISQGGTTVEDNLVTLCGRCHRRLHEREETLSAVRPPV